MQLAVNEEIFTNFFLKQEKMKISREIDAILALCYKKWTFELVTLLNNVTSLGCLDELNCFRL